MQRSRSRKNLSLSGPVRLLSSANLSDDGSITPPLPSLPSSNPIYGMPASWHRNARDGAGTSRVRRCFGTGADAGAGALRRGLVVSAPARSRRVCGAVGAGGQAICRVTACGITPPHHTSTMACATPRKRGVLASSWPSRISVAAARRAGAGKRR